MTYSVPPAPPPPWPPPVGVAAPLPLLSLLNLSLLDEREKFRLCSLPPLPLPPLDPDEPPPPRFSAASRWVREVWFFSESSLDFFDFEEVEEAELLSDAPEGRELWLEEEAWLDRLDPGAVEEAVEEPCSQQRKSFSTCDWAKSRAKYLCCLLEQVFRQVPQAQEGVLPHRA